MAIKKAGQKPRSPTAGKVFEAFVAQLRADPMIGDAIADRMETVLQPGQVINPANLQDALFPAEEANGNDTNRDNQD